MRIFIDIDNTIFDTDNRMIGIFTEKGKGAGCSVVRSQGYAKAFNVTDLEIREVFCAKDFYSGGRPIPSAVKTIEWLSQLNDVEVIFFTNGTAINNARKLLFIAEHFPYARCIANSFSNGVPKDKSIVEMTKNDILIDDSKDVLESTNAGIKILYRHNTKTRADLHYGLKQNRMTVDNWEDVESLLRELYNFRHIDYMLKEE